jgi:hypothetical protein
MMTANSEQPDSASSGKVEKHTRKSKLKISVIIFGVISLVIILLWGPRCIRIIGAIWPESKAINISGNILNQDGIPVNDVTMKIRFSRLSLIKWGSIDYKKTITTQSQFSIHQTGYSGLMIDFHKEGYFPERKTYSIFGPSKYCKNNIYLKTNEKVVLREIGKRVKLKKFEKLLKYDWKRKKKSFCNLTDLSYETLPADSLIKAKKYIYLDFERDQGGQVLMMVENIHGTLIPKTLIVKYVSDDKDDGFIVKGYQIDMTYLTYAPEADYNVRSIKIPYKSKDIYFYYKNGNSFGKGALLSSNTSSGKSRVWLQLMQNNEKDSKEKRNLRSGKML